MVKNILLSFLYFWGRHANHSEPCSLASHATHAGTKASVSIQRPLAAPALLLEWKWWVSPIPRMKMEMKTKTMPLPAHARIIMSWCRLFVQFYTLPNQQGAPRPLRLIICAVCDPVVLASPPFFLPPSILHGLSLYQFVALATRGAFLSVPLICSMLQQSASKWNEICYFLLFPSVLFLHALQCDWLQTCSPFFQISLICSGGGGIFLWNYEEQLFGQLLFVAIYWGNNLPDGTFWSCQFLACKQRASFSLNRMALNFFFLKDRRWYRHSAQPAT